MHAFNGTFNLNCIFIRLQVQVIFEKVILNKIICLEDSCADFCLLIIAIAGLIDIAMDYYYHQF